MATVFFPPSIIRLITKKCFVIDQGMVQKATNFNYMRAYCFVVI